MASDQRQEASSGVEERPEKTELSAREREILRLVATGASNKEIALQLVISPNTVKVHIRNIFGKIGAASRTEATLHAIGAGLVEVPGAPGNGVAANVAQVLELTTAQPTAEVVAPTGEFVPGRNGRGMAWTVGLAGLVAVVVLALVATWVSRKWPAATQAPAANNVSSPAPTQVRWQRKASMPTARRGLAAAVYENSIYAIAGETAEGVTGAVESYDPETDKWTPLSVKPLAVADVSAAVIGGLIYVPGGREQAGNITDRMEVYDPARDVWEQRASLPVTLSAYAIAAVEGKLYVFGGWNGERYVRTCFEYSPQADTWIERTAMPTARGFAAATVAGGSVYILGGRNDSTVLATNEQYQPARDIGSPAQPWQSRTDLPDPRAGLGAVTLADTVLVFGGQGPEAPAVPLQFFPGANTWAAIEKPNDVAWSDMATVMIETTLYVVGGRHDARTTADQMSYQALFTAFVPIIQ